MERLCDMDIYNLDIKVGDVKVDSEELKLLFECLQNYHSILCNSLDIMSDEEKQSLENGIALVEYMQNKYLVLGHLRKSQKKMFDLLKKADDKDFTKNSTEEEIEKFRRTVWGLYLDDKTKREKLQAELDEMKDGIFGLFE